MTSKPSKFQIIPIRVTTNRQRITTHASSAVSTKLGGIAVWAKTQEELTEGIADLAEAILECAKPHLSITKPVLRKLVRDHRGESEIEDRLYSAVLGSVLRRGEVDITVCASQNDRPFRVLIHSSQLGRFNRALNTAEIMLRKDRIIEVPRLEKAIFGKRSYNTWSSTAHLLGRLSYLGIGRLDDPGTCSLVEELVC